MREDKMRRERVGNPVVYVVVFALLSAGFGAAMLARAAIATIGARKASQEVYYHVGPDGSVQDWDR